MRTVRISHDYIEQVVEAKSAEEAEAKVNPYGYTFDDRWQVDKNPEVFINGDFTERMYKPDEVSALITKSKREVITAENEAAVYKEAFHALSEFIYDKRMLGAEEIWHGAEIGGQMLDFNVYDGDILGDEGMIHVNVHPRIINEAGDYYTEGLISDNIFNVKWTEADQYV